MDVAPLSRQLGLTARHAAQGVAALPALLWNVPVDAVNVLAGTRIPRADIDPALDALGLPRAENPTERIAQDVVEAIAGTGGVVKLAQRATAGMDGSIARAISALFADSPGVQLAAGAGGAGAAGLARENDVGAMGQTLAAMGGGFVPVVTGAVSPLASIARRASEQARLAPTGTGPWGSVYGRLAGDPENAVAHLLRMGQGSVPGAATHPHAGAIDLIAKPTAAGGSAGIPHIGEYGRADVLEVLPRLLRSGAWYGKKSTLDSRTYLGDGTYEAVLRNKWDTKPQQPFVHTAYKQYPDRKTPLETNGTTNFAGLTEGQNSASQRVEVGILHTARDPRQYVGMDSPAQAAAKNTISVQALRDVLARALSGTALGQAITAP